MTTPQVVETSVTVNNNSPIQNYVHPDDQTQPTFEKPPKKYLYIIPASNKKAFIRLRGELMRYTRNSSTFKVFSDTREKFWKRLQSRAVTQLGFYYLYSGRLNTVTELNGFHENAIPATVEW